MGLDFEPYREFYNIRAGAIMKTTLYNLCNYPFFLQILRLCFKNMLK